MSAWWPQARVRDAGDQLTTLEKKSQEAMKPKMDDLMHAMQKKHGEADVLKKTQEVEATMHSLDEEDRVKMRSHVQDLKTAAERAAVAGSSRNK